MKQKLVFDSTSPGFLYTIVVACLTILAMGGVDFPASPGEIAGEITTTLNSSGYFALIGVLASSVIFPIWNAWKKGNLSFVGIFKNSLTWVAIATAVFAGTALFGLVFPGDLSQNLVAAIYAKDWVSLISIVTTVIIPTVWRFIKGNN